MTDTATATMGPPSARPTLLTVICILSFIAGIWGVYEGVKNLTMDPVAERAKLEQDLSEQMTRLGDKANEITAHVMESAHDIGVKGIENHRPIGISGIVLSLVSLLGVWQMWNLKKIGFWFYLLATIAGLVVSVVYLGGGWIALASVGVVGFFSLVFIILYAVNLKHMH